MHCAGPLVTLTRQVEAIDRRQMRMMAVLNNLAAALMPTEAEEIVEEVLPRPCSSMAELKELNGRLESDKDFRRHMVFMSLYS